MKIYLLKALLFAYTHISLEFHSIFLYFSHFFFSFISVFVLFKFILNWNEKKIQK